jgi:hypothetical protein
LEICRYKGREHSGDWRIRTALALSSNEHPGYADLEFGLHRRDAFAFTIEYRFSQPDSDADIRQGQGQALHAQFDLEELKRLSYDPPAYGRRLTQSFFADAGVSSAFAQARVSAQSLGAALRLRLNIGPSASELHGLRWELLRDPQDDTPLSTSETALFSRYLSSVSWQPVYLRAKGALRALIMVANPADLARYGLAAVDVPGETSRAAQAFGTIETQVLAAGHGRRATLNALMQALRDGRHDILYLACHGALVEDESWLWLEDDAGNVARTSGAELAERLQALQERPRLLVLASCESAGARSGDALAALGPRLAEAGLPAVVAMQDKISMQTVAEFMPTFWRELERDGQIDRAMAAARGAVRNRPDYWAPALFMRLKSGRIWYVPGFSHQRDELETWSSLAAFIRDKTCTPIIGWGLFEHMLFTRREIATRWADKHGFPLAPHDRDDLPRVAQYVATRQSRAYLGVAMREMVREITLRRYDSVVPESLHQAPAWSDGDVARALALVAEDYAKATPGNAYRQLAQLRLPLYLTTEPFDFLKRALEEAGAKPVVRVCPGSKWVPEAKAIYEDEPTVERPLIYHLFGHIDTQHSAIYAEDHYLDFLIQVTVNKSLIPSSVRAALMNTSLLFLGFQTDDWELRVFLRYLMAQEGREMLKFYSHATAQVEPDEGRITDVKRTQRYLEEYFRSENIGIYWGSSEDFLTELHRHT